MTLLNTASPFHLHVPEDLCNLVDHAAASTSKSRTDFMLDALAEAAGAADLDRMCFRVSEEQMKAFDAILDQPLSENLAYQQMMARKAPWER